VLKKENGTEFNTNQININDLHTYKEGDEEQSLDASNF
jgi:hypothetical protein